MYIVQQLSTYHIHKLSHAHHAYTHAYIHVYIHFRNVNKIMHFSTTYSGLMESFIFSKFV